MGILISIVFILSGITGFSLDMINRERHYGWLLLFGVMFTIGLGVLIHALV
jgi:hypothetical protein